MAGRAEALALLDAPDQVDARHDVPELVAPAKLDRASLVAEQVQEVVRLQDHVAELGVADPLLAALEARRDRVARDHLVHTEVLADVAQHVEVRHAAQPIDIVDDLGRARPREVEEAVEDPLLAADIVLDHLAGLQLPLGALAARVADQARAAA